jgi:hypothetical protein
VVYIIFYRINEDKKHPSLQSDSHQIHREAMFLITLNRLNMVNLSIPQLSLTAKRS